MALTLTPSPNFLANSTANHRVRLSTAAFAAEYPTVRIVGETVIVDLPDARILGSSLDEDKTGLYDRDRGLFRLRGNDDLIEAARREAEDRMVETARENDILEKAQNNAEESIRVLVTSLGYERVLFT